MSYVSSVRRTGTNRDGYGTYHVVLNKAVNGFYTWQVRRVSVEYVEIDGWNHTEYPEDPEFQVEVQNVLIRTMDGRELFQNDNDATIRQAMEDLCEFWETGN